MRRSAGRSDRDRTGNARRIDREPRRGARLFRPAVVRYGRRYRARVAATTHAGDRRYRQSGCMAVPGRAESRHRCGTCPAATPSPRNGGRSSSRRLVPARAGRWARCCRSRGGLAIAPIGTTRSDYRPRVGKFDLSGTGRIDGNFARHGPSALRVWLCTITNQVKC